ncbi:serine/threonine protein kinase [Myxococcus stipitatus DSM 14675]|uniref:Serine/threonine protein kinase n=1 Tax=Myxococcus stipitatus (strain DSM 14675 / JCM 12634 / Mx s8) TaxID=1278073 RepID=L7UGB4_MYXSD|nr:protein kinase [Myxococcus stipitatus]AGC47073.1 serine/threonine protein kinase [Myxococcus stipitatus DSM 14675]
MGTYRIVKKLAAGGMAEVFLGKVVGAEGFEKPVAVKRILPSFVQDASFVELFLREAKLSVTLQHGNVLQVLDLGTSAGQYYMVMEFVDGENLSALLKTARARQVPLGLREICFIAHQVAEGLAYAHGRTDPSGAPLNIVHRDVNPSNVMVSSNGGVKLADFGIAKVADEGRQETQAGVIKGKINYLSPEQVHGRPVDQRSDIFLLGLLLYEMLAGKRLFEGSTPQIIHALGSFNERTLEPLPGVPAPLWELLTRALAANPDARCPAAREFSESIQNFLFDHRLRVGSVDIASLFSRANPDWRSPLVDLAGAPGEEIRLEDEDLARTRSTPAREVRRHSVSAPPPPMLRPVTPPPAEAAVVRPVTPKPVLGIEPPPTAVAPVIAAGLGPRPSRARQQLGTILLTRGMLTPHMLNQALSLQKQRGGRLGQVLIQERWLEPDNLVRALSEQSGLPHITEDKLQSVPVPEELLKQIPRELCERLCAVPLAVRGRELVCAVLDPRDVQVTDALKFSTRAVAVQGLFASEQGIRKTLQRFYPPVEEAPAPYVRAHDPIPLEPSPEDKARDTRMMSQFSEQFTGRRVLDESTFAESKPPATEPVARVGPVRGDVRARMVLVVAEPSEPREAAVRLLLVQGLAAATSPAADAPRALSLGGYELVLVLEDAVADPAGLAQKLRSAHPQVEVRLLPSYSAALLGEGGPLAKLAELQARLLDGMLSMLAGSATLAPFLTKLARRLVSRMGAGRVEEGLLSAAASALALAARLEEPRRFVLPTRARALGLVGSGMPEVSEVLMAVLPEGDDRTPPGGRAAGALLCAARFVQEVQSAQPPTAKAAQALQVLRQDPRLPVAAMEALTTELESSTQADKAAPRVVVAETDGANAMTLQIRLMAEGLSTVRAKTRADVEKALAAGAQAAILADPLPDGDLRALLQAMRKSPSTEDLPIYLIVDKEDPAAFTAALDAGADDVMVRSASPEVLIAKLRRGIQQRQTARRGAKSAQ